MDTIINDFKQKLKIYNKSQRAQILKALDTASILHSKQLRSSGKPYIIHPVSVALTLVNMKMDYVTIVAALLHDVVEDTNYTLEMIKKDFSEEVAKIVDGVTKISKVQVSNKSEQEAESIRKMLIAMVSDIRIIFIKLADKIHNLKTIEFLPKERQIIYAKECRDIFAPLAERLGISSMKSEIEDLAFKTLEPEMYILINDIIKKDKNIYQDYIKSVEKKIQYITKKNGFKVTVSTRAKHSYSIFKKMKRKGLNLDQIFDIFGMRLICQEQNDCYSILGLIHANFNPMAGRFKDYIAMPKANKYQSLHTTVMCENGLILEIQIRTEEMHQRAEYGIAAHWAYKKNIKIEDINNNNLVIINKMKNWNNSNLNYQEFLKEIKQDLLKDSIYVFTPKGQIIELPAGATPLDFAYHIHTQIGNQCVGAKCNGKIISLGSSLTNSQIVEIITNNSSHPSINWLKIVKTSTAKNKIRQWLNKNSNENLEEFEKKQKPLKEEKITEPIVITQKNIKEFSDKTRLAYSVGNDKNYIIKTASCCAPMPKDKIIGYLSKSRGIIVHKVNCKNLSSIEDFEKRKIIVNWEITSDKKLFQIDIITTNSDTIFTEIEKVLKNYNGSILKASVSTFSNQEIIAKFSFELNRSKDFDAVKRELKELPFVINIKTDS